MTITASVFAARYKLACFYIANHLFESIITTDPEINLASLDKLQRDGGFFMASLRVVEQLTAFKSDSEVDMVQKKIEATGTMYFKKSILTAVIKQGPSSLTEEEDSKTKKSVENLYDKHFVKKLYDSYFSAYVEELKPIEFLDSPNQAQETNDLVSIYELGVFDSQTLRDISDILDFSQTAPALAIAQTLSVNPRYATYKHFFGLVSKCL